MGPCAITARLPDSWAPGPLATVMTRTSSAPTRARGAPRKTIGQLVAEHEGDESPSGSIQMLFLVFRSELAAAVASSGRLLAV